MAIHQESAPRPMVFKKIARVLEEPNRNATFHRFYDFEFDNQYFHTGFADKCTNPEEKDL